MYRSSSDTRCLTCRQEKNGREIDLSPALTFLCAIPAAWEAGRSGNGAIQGRVAAGNQAFLFFKPSSTACCVIGMWRTRTPTALKIAFATAGATVVEAGSPTPLGWCFDGTRC